MELLNETIRNIKPLNEERMLKKKKELDGLLKTPEGLGRLEGLAIQLEGIRKSYSTQRKAVVVMAADNGVEREGVSSSRRIITQYVVEAMLQGRASVNSLAEVYGADVKVIDMGIDRNTVGKREMNLSGIISRKIMENGTKNMAEGPAMDYRTAVKSIETGVDVASMLVREGYGLLAVGEMGIGNTTTSSAMLKALTSLPLDNIVGYGSGIDEKGRTHKKNVIEKSLEINRLSRENQDYDPIEVLSKVGGLDIGGMAGIYLGCAASSVPVVIDGFISSVAALLAYRFCKDVKGYMIPSHLSEEPGMKYIMNEMGMRPSLFMDMKLGEGTGAVMMFPVIEGALNITRTVRRYPEL